MGNSNHDERGRFSSGSGAATGDHLAAQPADTSKRHVPGHGLVDRSVPVVGPRISAAARDLVIRNKGIDQRHYGVPFDPQATQTRRALDPRMSKLISGGPGKPRVRATAQINARMNASASAAPRTQPSAGQLVGAKVITPQ